MTDHDETQGTMEYHFGCQSPIFMCPRCSKAETCQDLMTLLSIFQLREPEPETFDYRSNFPFLKTRDLDPLIDPHNKLNEMTSGEWLSFSRTMFNEAAFPKVFSHELRRRHPDYKPPHLLGRLIAFFTQPGDMVLDPFAGTGTSLVAASLLNREAVGFEANPDWIELYYEICDRENIAKQKMVQGNCDHLVKFLPPDSADFIIIDPPNPIHVQEWAGPVRLNKPPLEAFFDFMNTFLVHCYKVLRPKKYLAVFTHNLYYKSNYYYLTPYYAAAAEDAGFVLKGEKIYENKAEKMRPYGYPHTYVPNIVHFNILIFRRE
jgi:DNA modification methylase